MRREFLQDSFLNGLCTQRAWVAVYLTSGVKLQGYLIAFDQHTLLLKNTTEQLIFKHAIATVGTPIHIEWQPNPEEVEEGEEG